MSALEVLDKAKKAGVRLTLDGDAFIAEIETPPLPADVVAELRAAKPDIMSILTARAAGEEALRSRQPMDCPPARWEAAVRGLERFLAEGWADAAAAMGWTAPELYRLPPLWSQIWLVGAGWLIGDRRVIAVTESNIVIKASAGSCLKFRRVGREHIA
jgi:hypothetical protein